jgi:hypothetical protein
MFYEELSSLLDERAMLAEPVIVVGEINIRLYRPDDTNTRRLSEMFEAYGLTCRVSGPTHDRDGTLDVVAVQRAVIWQHQLLIPSLTLATLTIDWFAGRVISRNRRQCTLYDLHPPIGHGDALMSHHSKKRCGLQLYAVSLMTPVTMMLNDSRHCTIARSMPLRTVLCHSSL